MVQSGQTLLFQFISDQMSDNTSSANPPEETEKKMEEKMDSVGTKKEEKTIEEEIGYKRLIIFYTNYRTTFILMPTEA